MNEGDRKQLGIIGAGRIGHAMAGIAQRAGRHVVISNSRGPHSLTSVVSSLGDGVSAGTVEQAAAASIVVLAVPWSHVAEAVRGLDWRGQIVIDATNDFDPSDLDGRTSSELVADLVRPAPVVKTANTLVAALLASDPRESGGRRVIFLSGDDTDAKSEVVALFDAAGFSPIDLGGLSAGGTMQQVGGPLAGVNLIRVDAPDVVSRSDLARAIFAAFDAKDVSALAEFMTDDVRLRLGNAETVVGKSGFVAAVNAFLSSVAGFRHEILNEWTDGDALITQLDVHYTRLDGGEVTVPCCNVFRLRDGKVSEYFSYIDATPVYS
jgi:predicted dinucleotide-binding enzyme/ketosteroid isomerase-like protein